jgi:Flp pilus assembly pilin Flp
MKRESGATMVEYVLMVSLIAIALVVSIILFRGAMTDNLGESVDCLESIKAGAGDCPGVPANGN